MKWPTLVRDDAQVMRGMAVFTMTPAVDAALALGRLAGMIQGLSEVIHFPASSFLIHDRPLRHGAGDPPIADLVLA